MQAFLPVAAANPIVGIILAGVSILVGLFRGSGNKELRQAIDGVRVSLADIADSLMRFTWMLARAFGVLLALLHKFWVRVLHPILERIQEIANRLGRLIDRVLKPILDWIARVRKIILDIYEKWVRPVLVLIERVRRVLRILALLHVPFADKLDKRLAALEAKLIAPLLAILAKTNELTGWLNFIITARLLLQENLLLNSLGTYSRSWAPMVFSAYDVPLSDSDLLRRRQVNEPPATGDTLDALRAVATHNSGRLAAPAAAAIAAARARFR